MNPMIYSSRNESKDRRHPGERAHSSVQNRMQTKESFYYSSRFLLAPIASLDPE